jgi:hypothetical protein
LSVGLTSTSGDLVCQPMKVPGAGVVAKSFPRFHHARGLSAGDIRERRKLLEKFTISRHDARYLRLLEHELRDKDLVRDPRPSPREITAVRPEPSSKTPTEGLAKLGFYWKRPSFRAGRFALTLHRAQSIQRENACSKSIRRFLRCGAGGAHHAGASFCARAPASKLTSGDVDDHDAADQHTALLL